MTTINITNEVLREELASLRAQLAEAVALLRRDAWEQSGESWPTIHDENIRRRDRDAFLSRLDASKVQSCEDCDCADPLAITGLSANCDCRCHKAGAK